MRRRLFLQQFAFCTGFFLFDLARPSFGARPVSSDALARWAQLLEYARWSPSPHNVQPWKVRPVSATEAELYYDPQRLLPHTDPTSRFTIAGLGMFIECLTIAANPLGYAVVAEHTTTPRLDYEAQTPQLFARLKLVPTRQRDSASPDLIKQRRTSRLAYDERPLTPAIQQELAALAARYGHALTFSTEPEMVDFVLDLNRETLFQDLDEEPVRRELARWVRTSKQEAYAKNDGLWNHCFGFPGRTMHNFFFHSERFRSPWKRRVIGSVYRRSMRGTTTIAWLHGPFGNRTEWLQAGAMLQRLWLAMTQHGVYLHPFGSVVTNALAHEKFQQKINTPATAQPLWLLVRMGYSQEPPRSLRLTVNDILLA